MANSNGWGDGAGNNSIGWGQGANNSIGWGSSHATSSAGLTDIVGITTDTDAQAFITTTGITGTIEQQAIDTLVKSLKSNNIWSKMKAVYPFVTDNRNLLSYTSTFGNSYYVTDGTASFTPNNTTAPDGTMTGTKMTATSFPIYFYSANTHQGQSFGNGNKTLSIYVKAGNYSGDVALSITSDGTTQQTNITLNNTWQRISVSKNVITAGGTAQYYIALSASGISSSQYFYIYGVQFENGLTATTYQPIATTQQTYISSQFKYNLKDPRDLDAAFRLVFNGGLTHSSTGILPNGVNGYANTNLKISTAITNPDSLHFSTYLRTNSTAAFEIGSQITYGVDVDTFNNGPFHTMYFNTSGPTGVWSGQNAATTFADTTTLGLYTANRNGTGQLKAYKNNVLKSTISSGTAATNSYNFILMGCNDSYPDVPSFGVQVGKRQMAFSTIGTGLSDTEQANLYTAVQAFQTTLGRQV